MNHPVVKRVRSDAPTVTLHWLLVSALFLSLWPLACKSRPMRSIRIGAVFSARSSCREK